ncbi:MAG: hypothetical protein J5623_06315 [Clostridiales bacterium]|nr:hypothetical protein [Clostridiales bacterium]
MRRINRKRRSKIAMTMVELIVTMALTSLFAGACVTLILPIERIYTHMTDLSRAQLIADTCVDTLRKECADTYIIDPDDVWIFNDTAFDGTVAKLGSAAKLPDNQPGKILVMRKNSEYWETTASTSTYNLGTQLYNDVMTIEGGTQQTGNLTSRAIYRMFTVKEGNVEPNSDAAEGYVHFGYYKKIGSNNYSYYDFTNPIASTAYRDFKVELTFDGLKRMKDTNLPAYVNCTVTVTRNGKEVYSRNTVLCFAAPAI